eukprot:EG_transcript_5029
MSTASAPRLRPFWQGYTFVSTDLEQVFQARFWESALLPTNLWCCSHLLMALAAIIGGLFLDDPFVLIHLGPLLVSVGLFVALNWTRAARFTRRRLQETVVAMSALATVYYLLYLHLETTALIERTRNSTLAPIYYALQNSTQPQLVGDLDRYVQFAVAWRVIDQQLLFNTLQFWMLVVFGFSYLVVLGILLIAVITLAGFFVNPHTPLPQVLTQASLPLILTVLSGVLFSMAMASLRRRQFVSEHRYEAELESALTLAQSADTILNHTLKNTMADAAAEIEVFLSQARERDPHLVSSMECLRRGMRSCRYRQAYLMLADRKYKPVYSAVKLDEFGAELCAGRPMSMDCIPNLVLLDEVLVGLILDNAINNAFKHGRPCDPEVTFAIRDTTARQGAGDQRTSRGAHPPAPSLHITFTITNRASTHCPVASDVLSISMETQTEEDDSLPILSNRVGLQHSALAAEAHGMNLSLSQTSDLVTFEAGLWVTLAPADRHGATTLSDVSMGALDSYTRGLTVYCIDDSASARRLLTYNLMKHLSSATVRSFGESAADVPQFISLVLQEADIAILDEYLDFHGSEMVLGSDLVRQLRAAGFTGLLCIRSANVAGNECDRYYSSGADVVFGKDLPMTQLITQLRVAFVRKKRHPAISLVPHDTRRPSISAAPPRTSLWASRSNECMPYGDRRSAYTPSTARHSPEPTLPELHVIPDPDDA